MSKLTDKVSDALLHARDACLHCVPIDIPGVRGNIPDITDLEHDIVPEEPHTSNLSSRQTDLITATDSLLFSVSIGSFLSSKAAQSPVGLDWADDGCSDSPDKPWGFNFLDSCKRHDFGYRNYKAQGRFMETNRLRIDVNFKNDLMNECNKSSRVKKVLCRKTAETYYDAVRLFGNLKKNIK
ncbi:prokaryotic phospholipase A2-domain-containing protein [Terfezia claveryi]|nr:prokaryotic phospholipase A2-domain-containing protein [Terfezia claveryi]